MAGEFQMDRPLTAACAGLTLLQPLLYKRYVMLRFPAVSLFVLGLSAGAASADLSAEDVWQDWQALLGDLGYSVSGAPERAGNGLVIPDFGLSQSLPDAGGRVDMRLGRIALRERGDGTVEVIYPETMPMALAVTPEKGDAVTAIVTLRHEGLGITASGTPDRVVYTYAADDLRVDLGEVTIGGAPVDGAQGMLRLGAVTGRSEGVSEDGARRVTQEISAGPVGYSFAFDDPENGVAISYEGAAESLDYDGSLRLPEGAGLDDLPAALRAGLRIANRMTFGPGESRFSGTEDGIPSRGTSRSAGTVIEMTTSEEGLGLGFRSDDLEARMEGGGLPFPIGYAAERAAGSLFLPVARDDAAQPFALSLDLAGLSLAEEVWAMLDPAAALPRDPASLRVDLSGTGKLMVDLFDEAAMAALETGDRAAFEPERLVLDSLLLDLAGATLTGAGALDIEPGDGTGMPAAEGAVDLRLEGGNGLLDRLVAMGVLPKDQAMTVRMMAAMFSVPVADEPDTLTSRVEFGKDGSIAVNGQRMR